MKFILVAPFLTPRIGGIEAHSLGLAASLSVKHQVTTISHDLDLEGYGEGWPGQTVRISSFLISDRLPVFKPSFRSLRSIFKALREPGVDLVVVQSYLFPLSLFVLIASRCLRKPTLLMSHGSGFLVERRPIIRSLLHIYELFMRSSCRLLAGKTAGVSSEAAHWIDKNSARVIPNAIDHSSPARIALLPSDRENTAVIVGRLVPGKGLDQALLAAQKSLRLEKIHVVGDGPERHRLVELAKSDPRVQILGSESRDSTLARIADAKFLINLSSYPDGLPTVLLEAASLRTFVIARGAGVGDLFAEVRGGGYMVTDDEAVPAVIDRLIENPRMLDRETKLMLQHVRRRFSWDRVREMIEELAGQY